MSATPRSGRSPGAYQELDRTLSKYCSNLYALVAHDWGDASQVTFKHQGENVWLVVVKRYGDDGAPQVLFATAYDFVGAVLAVNAAIASGSWKPDKPWKPPA